MRVWGIIKKNNKTIADTVKEFDFDGISTVGQWQSVIDAVCKELDLSHPVVLEKHLREIVGFSRTTFRASDFIESVDFDKLEIELFADKDRKR